MSRIAAGVGRFHEVPTEIPTESDSRKCSRIGCNERFALVLRGGRNSDKAMAGRQRTYHKGQRYCSDTCRKLASKARLQSSPKRAEKSRYQPSLRLLALLIFQWVTRGKKIGSSIPQNGLRRLRRRAGFKLAEDVPRSPTRRQHNRTWSISAELRMPLGTLLGVSPFRPCC